MRRGHIKRPRKKVLPLRIIIPLVFLIIGVGAAYSLVTGTRAPEPRPEPIIIRPDPIPDFGDGEFSTVEGGTFEPLDPDIPIDPINPDIIAGPVADERQDQFTGGRVAAYSVPTALQASVNQFGANRANQCAGEIIVVTRDGDPLNVRSVPSTANNQPLSQVSNGSRHSVLLWAPDTDPNRRWFLIVSGQTVVGWVRSDLTDNSNVVYAN